MTREEAIHILENLKPTNAKSSFDAYVVGNAIAMAIEALEQEPCEDCISRAEAEALFREARINLNPKMYKSADEFNTRDLMLLNAEQMIHLLPSVQPKRPQKWIYSDLLRVKHGTMNIDALIDKVYADMRESEVSDEDSN